MKRALLLILGAALLLGTMGGGVAVAQTAIVNVPFQFTANHKVMQPGKYEITLTDAAVISIVPVKGPAIFVPTITRLAQHGSPMVDAEVVFDKLENEYALSEVWLPGEDGFLVMDTKAPHKHHVLKGTKKTS